jgi:octaprenyl-diphosphate synthase
MKNPPRLDLKTLLAPIAGDLARMDGIVRERLASEVALIDQIGAHIVRAGGKRMRPAILLLMARALGCRTSLPELLAAVIEFIHTATLLHDDVVDHADRRRGLKTANAVWGNAGAVLTGDFLYSRSFQMMVDSGRMEVMRVLADTTNAIAEGEVLQLMNCGDPDVTEARYLRVIELKTARLFEAAARLGAIAADADAAAQEQAAATVTPWAWRSRWWTTCSITRPRPRNPARISARTSPKASPRCPSSTPWPTARRHRPG